MSLGYNSLAVDKTGFYDWNGVPICQYTYLYDDCNSATLAGGMGWTASTASGGTAVVSSIFTANHPGLYAVSDGGNAAGVACIRNPGNNILFGTRKKRMIMCVRTPTALSDGTDTYELLAGFGDSTTTTVVTDGAYLHYTHSASSGNWEGITKNGGASTLATGGTNVAVTAATDFWLGIEADSTSVKFYVAPDNAGAPGTWVLIGTSSTNLPTGNTTGQIFQLGSSAGTRVDTFHLDKVIYIP
jgi:hypothetical protein